MINTVRNKEIPVSLQRPEIRKYIDLVNQHSENPESSEKPMPPVTYRNSDILENFDVCFFGKCYLTEQKFFNSWMLDIDHFIPQNERPDLIYEWTNLYPAEHKANMMKPRKTPQGGYFDPCSDEDDVEKEIIYFLLKYGQTPKFKPNNVKNQKAVNSCELLELLHNGKTEHGQKNTEHLRHLIKKRYDQIMEKMANYLGAIKNGEQILKLNLEEELRLLLSRKASFTMLMRSIEPIKKHFPIELLD